RTATISPYGAGAGPLRARRRMHWSWEYRSRREESSAERQDLIDSGPVARDRGRALHRTARHVARSLDDTRVVAEIRGHDPRIGQDVGRRSPRDHPTGMQGDDLV